MALDDKANNTVINHLGAAKEGAGRLTGNDELKREGQQDQAQAKLKEAGEKVKDAAAGIGENLKDAAHKLKQGFSKD
jgi:uncharacterized protein YjbJ (UPF0337 family)